MKKPPSVIYTSEIFYGWRRVWLRRIPERMISLLVAGSAENCALRTGVERVQPTGFSSVSAPTETRTRSPGSRLKLSGGMMPVPVIRNAPCGKASSVVR